MLSMSTKNCAAYKDAIKVDLDNITMGLDYYLKANYNDIFMEMQEKDLVGTEVCDYLTWAHFNAVPLKGDPKRQEDYKSLVDQTCRTEYYNKTTQAVLKVNEANSNLVASAFLTNLRDRVKLGLNKSGNGADLPLAYTTYQSYTADILLAVAIQAL